MSILPLFLGFGLAGLPVPLRPQEAAAPALGPLSGAELELPARANARWPSLAAGADGHLYATWIEPEPSRPEGEEGLSVLAVARLEGQRWRRLADAAAGRGWFVNWADFPSLAALADGTLAASFLERHGEGTYAYEVRLALSRDGGASWSEPFCLHDDRQPAEHGFVSLEPQGERFAAVWLDGRATAAGGPMALFARTIDSDGTLGAELCLDERVCDCCQTAAVAVGEALVVAYRDRGAEELRDIAWLTVQPGAWTGGSQPDVCPLAPDGWKIPGCPVNGPALAARGDELAAAWFTLGADGRPRVLARRIQPAGAGVETVVVSEDDPLGRVDLAFDGEGALWVSWLERRGEQAEWTAARLPSSGEPDAGGDLERTPLARVGSIGREAGFGRLAFGVGALHFVWTDPGQAGGPSAVRSLRLAEGPRATR